MSTKNQEHLDTFWELIVPILNSVLFVLIGLEIFIVTFNVRYLEAGLLLIPVILFARFEGFACNGARRSGCFVAVGTCGRRCIRYSTQQCIGCQFVEAYFAAQRPAYMSRSTFGGPHVNSP